MPHAIWATCSEGGQWDLEMSEKWKTQDFHLGTDSIATGTLDKFSGGSCQAANLFKWGDPHSVSN